MARGDGRADDPGADRAAAGGEARGFRVGDRPWQEMLDEGSSRYSAGMPSLKVRPSRHPLLRPTRPARARGFAVLLIAPLLVACTQVPGDGRDAGDSGRLIVSPQSSPAVPDSATPRPSLLPSAAPDSSAPHASSSTELSFSFQTEPFAIRHLLPSDLPYVTGRVTPLEAKPPTDEQGIRQFRTTDGELYDHPVWMAQEILRLLDSYEAGGGDPYLQMAERNADRLLADAVYARGAVYFPYRFDFALLGNPDDLMSAPWYSAMAQGQALSGFVRLYLATQDERWRQAADLAFASFTWPRAEGEPWTVFVDADGYLWLEEYPKDPPLQVLNGHIYAIFGLYEYFELTGSPVALQLLRGALATVKHYGESFRNPGRLSAYDLRVRATNAKYHAIHIKQLRLLAEITGDATFNHLADEFAADSPPIRINDSEV